MYDTFAYYYDELNGVADYHRLHRFIRKKLKKLGVKNGILADLGCGTGQLTLALAKDGYEMLAVDSSEEMLEMLSQKLVLQPKLQSCIQLLNQDILALDLFGSIQGAVSTFDTLNHIGPVDRLEKALYDIAFFMDKDAVFLFDMNTPYKHLQVLENKTFSIEDTDVHCIWKNELNAAQGFTKISLETREKASNTILDCESFAEYFYPIQTVEILCDKVGLSVLEVCDGDTFTALKPESQRMMFVTQKRYTQLQKD